MSTGVAAAVEFATDWAELQPVVEVFNDKRKDDTPKTWGNVIDFKRDVGLVAVVVAVGEGGSFDAAKRVSSLRPSMEASTGFTS